MIEALELMGERPNVPFAGMSIVELVITDPDHAEDHPTKEVDIAIGVDIGFKWNETNETFEFIADRQTWSKNIPIERFLDKVTQQYARMIIHDTIKSEGFEVEDEYEMDDNTIELTVNRWV